MKDQADLPALFPSAGKNPTNDEVDAMMQYLRDFASKHQQGILEQLKSYGNEVVDLTPFWIANELSFKAPARIIRAIASRADVDIVEEERIFTIPPYEVSPAPSEVKGIEWHVTIVQADKCWNAGYAGQGIVVGNIDTGVYKDHPCFGGRWRQTNGWYDAVGGQPNPYDDNGHGTHTMGIICGGDGFGPFVDDIGVAPGANFIMAKGLDVNGSGSQTQLTNCLTWMANTGRPHVLSNSWGSTSTTSTAFWAACATCRSAGIRILFSIGNSGPNPNTAGTPGNYPIVMGVGSTDQADGISSFSSRGPAPNQSPWNVTSNWDRPDWNRTKPDISAPGAGIRSASNTGSGYVFMSGTSMASPNAAGCMAIGRQYCDTASHRTLYRYITDFGNDRPAAGAPYPNNNYGWGRINAYKLIKALPARAGVQLCVNKYSPSRIWPSQTSNITVELLNLGSAQATTVNGRLRKPAGDPYITINDSTAVYGTINARDSVTNTSDPFTITAAAGTPAGYQVILPLYVTTAQGNFNLNVIITVGMSSGTVIWGPKNVTNFPTDVGLYGAAYDPKRNRLWVTHFRARQINAYSTDSNVTYITNIPTPNNDTACLDLGFCPWDSMLWVADYRDKRIYKINPDNGAIRYSFVNPCNDYPIGLAWDGSYLWLTDRRTTLGAVSLIKRCDTLGGNVQQWNHPSTANYASRCLAFEPRGPGGGTLLNVLTCFNAGGTQLDSVGLWEITRASPPAIRQRVLFTGWNARGVEYDPRDGSYWIIVMQSPDNTIVKIAGFYMVGIEEALTDRPLSTNTLFLFPSKPNPFKSDVKISYQLPARTNVRLSIYDATGRLVTTLVNRAEEPGLKTVIWTGKTRSGGSIASGVYFYRLETKDQTLTRKLVFTR